MSNGDRAFVGSIPEIYDRYLGPMLFEPYATELASRLSGFSGQILETAAGTGRLTRALLRVVAPTSTITAMFGLGVWAFYAMYAAIGVPLRR